MQPADRRPLVLHVVYSFAVGGLENGLVNLINRLSPHRWRHAVVSLTEVSEAFRARIERQDVAVCALHKAPGHSFRLYPRLFGLFRRYRPSIVHTRNLAALEATLPAWAAGVPVRIHGEHGRDTADPDGTNLYHQWLRRAFSPFVNHYITVSADLASYLATRVGIGQRRIHQVCNGVDAIRFHPVQSRAQRRGETPFDDASLFVVGAVGRLETIKNQSLLAHAFVRALAVRPELRGRLRLAIIGAGGLRSEIESILDRANARPLAWLPGERADIPQLLRGLDCFVLPSLAEGISNTILEAMASGLPVIATRVGGNAELVEDGMTGALVPSQDVDAMATAILRYANDPSLSRRHGRAGRSRVERRFSLDQMVGQYEAIYSEALMKRGKTRFGESAPRGL